MYLTEAGAFTIIVLKIGQLGDIPLRATTMAINFNMIAFIPLIGVAIAASVLVGRHLLQNGAEFAVRTTMASLIVAFTYSLVWAIAYVLAGDWMLSFYSLGNPDTGSLQAIEMASVLLRFVALYVLLDAVQLIIAAALKGAGDTWFVLLAGAATSLVSIGAGITWDPGQESLNWWWWVITFWIWTLAVVMTIRFIGGKMEIDANGVMEQSISVALLPNHLHDEDELQDSCVIIIDVLRATTVMTVAGAAGCDSVRTCAEIDEARSIAAASADGTLLCGERHCRRIEGFDLGNFTSGILAGHRRGKTADFDDHQRNSRYPSSVKRPSYDHRIVLEPQRSH